MRLAFLFIVVGYGTKAGFAPMHTWLPDGHAEAPAPISALLSGVLLKSALYAILRFYTIANACIGDRTYTSAILLGAGVVSLVLAAPLILKEQNPFKRVLAYHSLEHMGIITFGVGIGAPLALFGALLHTFNHATTKSLMFLAFGNIMRRYEARGIQAQQAIDLGVAQENGRVTAQDANEVRVDALALVIHKAPHQAGGQRGHHHGDEDENAKQVACEEVSIEQQGEAEPDGEL